MNLNEIEEVNSLHSVKYILKELIKLQKSFTYNDIFLIDKIPQVLNISFIIRILLKFLPKIKTLKFIHFGINIVLDEDFECLFTNIEGFNKITTFEVSN